MHTTTHPTPWEPFWLRLDRELRAMPPTYELFIHAAHTPEPDVPALDDAIDDLAKEEAA